MHNLNEHQHKFWYWINERHNIYLRRQAGESAPWTDDPILQKYRFCNVFRELDRVTCWIRNHWRRRHRNTWFAMCIARQINWPPTLGRIGFPFVWEPDKVFKTLTEMRNAGEKIYTGAYMLRGDIQRNHNTTNDKPSYTVYSVLDPVYKAYQKEFGGTPYADSGTFPFQNIEGVTRWLSKFHGWGGFLSYEVATDLRHTFVLQLASDIHTWANPGPGARRGLNRYHGRPVKAQLTVPNAVVEMRDLLAKSGRHLGIHVPDLEMRDIEHSLCEYDKYMRVYLGEGRPRGTYRPSTDNF